MHAVATFDRYLLGRFVSIYAVMFTAMLGLFAIVDGFTNLDAFQSATEGQGFTAILQTMGTHYVCQSFAVFNMLGQTLGIVAAMSVLALALKNGEIHPLLAAGVKGHRVILPLAIGLVGINVLMAANRELVLPQLANRLTGSHGDVAKEKLHVDSTYDRNGIFVIAASANATTQTLQNVEFRLPLSDLCDDYAVLRATDAKWLPAEGDRPGGWGLIGLDQPLATCPLTEKGRQVIHAVPSDPNAAMVESSLSFTQLRDRSRSYQFLSTPDLIRRISETPRREAAALAQVMHLHSRLAGPLLNVIGVFIIAPLVVRRDKWSIVSNMATASIVVGVVFGASQAFSLAGSAGMLRPDVAAWAPIVGGGGLAGWLSGEMRT